MVVVLGLGLYIQWQVIENSVIFVILLVGLLVFGLVCVLQFYFYYFYVGRALFYIWLGCILGIIVFSEEKEIQYMMSQEVMNILFIISLCVYCFWIVLQRVLRLYEYRLSFYLQIEVFEGTGFIIFILIIGNDAVVIFLMVCVVFCNLVVIRFKFYFGLLNFVGFLCLVVFVFYKDLSILVNLFGLVCFIGRYFFEFVIDLYFLGLFILERWESFFRVLKFWRYVIIFFIFIFNLVIGGIVGRLSVNYKEWFIVVFFFVVFVVFWLSFYFLFFVTCWKLMNRIIECNLIFVSFFDDNKNMN